MIWDEISGADNRITEAAKRHWDGIAKPVDGLGEMENIITKIAGAQGSDRVDISRKALVVYCSDNGVTRQNISQVDSSVTGNIVRSIVAGTSSVAVMAKAAHTDVYVIDTGVLTDEEGVIDIKLMHGSDDISEGPAMSYDVALATIEKSADFISGLKTKGYNIIATGEAGIGNTTTSAALASALLKMDARVVTGRGSGLTDEAYAHKIDIVRQALSVNDIENVSDVIDVLVLVGGLDIAGLTGAYIGAALNHIPIIMDGFISAVAALIACRLNPKVKDYIIPSHMSREPAMVKICEELGINPVIYADMHLGEGTGAVLMMSMLDTAMAVYDNAATFDHIEVKQYERLQ